MPRLPSGQKVGLSNHLITAIGENPIDYLEEIVTIRQVADTYRFIPIIKYVETDEVGFKKCTFDKASANIHEVDGLKAVVMEYTVQDVFDQLVDWSQQDIMALDTWLNSGPIRGVLNQKLIKIEDRKISIDDLVDALAFTDLDPDQDEEEKYRRAANYIKAVRKIPAG